MRAAFLAVFSSVKAQLSLRTSLPCRKIISMIMKSPILKRSVTINGRKSSVSLEEAFWTSMKEIAAVRHLSTSDLVDEIGATSQGNLSSANSNLYPRILSER